MKNYTVMTHTQVYSSLSPLLELGVLVGRRVCKSGKSGISHRTG